MSDYITDWLIGISNTDADGVTMYRFRGTRKDVKELLAKLAAQDREKIRMDMITERNSSNTYRKTDPINIRHILFSQIRISITRHRNFAMYVFLTMMEWL